MIFLKIIVVKTLIFQNSYDLSTPEPFPAFLTRKGLLQISPEFQVLLVPFKNGIFLFTKKKKKKFPGSGKEPPFLRGYIPFDMLMI